MADKQNRNPDTVKNEKNIIGKKTEKDKFSVSPDMDRKMMMQDYVKDDDEMYGSDYMLADSEILDFSEGTDSYS
jgi:hypothetical protein